MRWDESDLRVRLCRALDTAKRAVEVFAEDGYLDLEVPHNSFRPEKPIAEAAMLIYAASAVGCSNDIASRIEGLARLLVPHARSQRTLLNIALRPSLCADFAVPHVLLTKLGYPDTSFDDLPRFLMDSQAWYGHERPPFASIEQRWIKGLWMGADPGPDWQPDLLNSVMYQPHDILGGLRQDAYAFTHLLMYCTDFGFRRARFPRPRDAGNSADFDPETLIRGQAG